MIYDLLIVYQITIGFSLRAKENEKEEQLADNHAKMMFTNISYHDFILIHTIPACGKMSTRKYMLSALPCPNITIKGIVISALPSDGEKDSGENETHCLNLA